MFLKISLIVAILVGIGTIVITHTQLSPKIVVLREERDTLQTNLTASQESEAKAKKEASDLRTDLDNTTRAFAEATNTLITVSQRLMEQEDRANKASADLEKVTGERNEARQELAQWRALGYPIDAMRNRLAQLDVTEKERDVLKEELQLAVRENDRLDRELKRYTGDAEQDVVLPAGTKGNVVAVDPKYDFVILDIGGNQGIIPNAKMLVNRDGKLIGKVQITAVEPTRSIANVMPEWKQDEIIEGDQVIY